MEYIGIEKDAVETVQRKVTELREMTNTYPVETPQGLKDWIENSELSELLGLSLGTLHNYRLSGKLGFSTIGKKIYYRRKDVEAFLTQRRIATQNTTESKKISKWNS